MPITSSSVVLPLTIEVFQTKTPHTLAVTTGYTFQQPAGQVQKLRLSAGAGFQVEANRMNEEVSSKLEKLGR